MTTIQERLKAESAQQEKRERVLKMIVLLTSVIVAGWIGYDGYSRPQKALVCDQRPHFIQDSGRSMTTWGTCR